MKKDKKQAFAVNVQPLCVPTLTGIGIYTKEIALRLLEPSSKFIPELHFFSFFQRKKMFREVSSHISVQDSRVCTCSLLPLGAYIRMPFLSAMIAYERAVFSKAKVTVFFNFLRPYRMKGKSIVTVHDMVCMRFPETMDERNRLLLKKFLPESCRNADIIMAVSEFSKKEIAECLSIPHEKICVAPCGINTEQFFPPSSDQERAQIQKQMEMKYNLRAPYLLYLGTLEPRKNVKTLLRAFVLLEKKYPELQLVLCGGTGWKYEETLAEIDRLGISEKVKRTGYIPESEKRAIYIGAECFVFPSLYEGFGMPPLEAMACGTPVVCSNASSLPEVVGDGGFLCEPENPDDFFVKIDQILSRSFPVERMCEQAKLQVEKYTWEKTAIIYKDSIEKLMAKK